MNKTSENQTNDKPRFYTILPAKIRYDTRLSSTAKLIYSEIELLARKNGYCFASSAYLASLYGVSVRQIYTCIKALTDCGYITAENKEGARRIYVKDADGMNDGMKKTSGDMKKTSRPCEENFRGGYEENFTHNNIKYNNKYNNYYNYNNQYIPENLRIDEKKERQMAEAERFFEEKIRREVEEMQKREQQKNNNACNGGQCVI